MSTATLQSLINDRPSLQWIFVGGKGGVGKTTTSCSLATLLARTPIIDAATGAPRERRVLIISTDPAHNLSDAFAQKFSKTPTPVTGQANLHGMEVDPSTLQTEQLFEDITLQGSLDESEKDGLRSVGSIVRQAAKTLPGIDEVTVFAEIIREIKRMAYDVVVFDTAPTGHTLRLLALPSTLNDSLDRLMDVKGLGALVETASQMMTSATGLSTDDLRTKLERWRANIKGVQEQFRDHAKTTFVCVCIPEFLSVYETERLIQELMKYDINVENIVVNQLVLKPSAEPPCRMCEARKRIQSKYLAQIEELYDGFNVVKMPLHSDEVRGLTALAKFSHYLVTAYDADTDGYL